MISPLVTIGIPTRNRNAYLMRAVASVLKQSYQQIEVVVSDNASNDDTLKNIKKIDDSRLRIVEHNENIGMVSNFNETLQAARGKYFIMLSDDDYLAPNAIEILINAFENKIENVDGNKVGVSWTPATIVDSNGSEKWVSTEGPACESGFDFIVGSFQDGRGPRFCGVMVRTSDARTVGGYQEKHGPPCDVGNWSQIALRYPYVVCTQKSLAFYTIHPSSETTATSSDTWKKSAESIIGDLLDYLNKNGRSAETIKMRLLGDNLIGDLLIAGFSQSAGQKGWTKKVIFEIFYFRKYLLTSHIAQRFLKNFWKLKSVIVDNFKNEK